MYQGCFFAVGNAPEQLPVCVSTVPSAIRKKAKKTSCLREKILR
jgi:hypothetical protein